MTDSISRELGLLKQRSQKGNPKFGKACCGEKTKDLKKKKAN